MQVRPYDDANAAAVAALFTASVHGLAAGHYDAAQRAAWAPSLPDVEMWRERLRGLRVLLAVEDDVITGFIGYDGSGHIDLLYTAPAHARRGTASLLYAQVERVLIADGVATATTEASEVARPFFERQGFSVVEAQAILRNGAVLRRYAMQKFLMADT